MQLNQKNKYVEDVLDWRKSLTVMEDSLFFELMRVYLGEIKTPYNKQKLIEELSSFLRKEENKKNLVKLLGKKDLLIINAIHFISDATQEKLADFFGQSFSFSALYKKLLNLQERLIIFTVLDETGTKQVFKINPLLQETLLPYINICTILPSAKGYEILENRTQTLSPLLIASFVAFILENSDICKLDGDFKKRALIALEKVFPNDPAILKILNCLLKAFINLSILKENGKGFFIDFDVLEAFSKLNEVSQMAYLTVASCTILSREGLKKQAQLLLTVANSIAKNGFTESVLIRASILILLEKQDEINFSKSRFSKMLEKKLYDDDSLKQNASTLERLLESAINFGIFTLVGKTQENERVFKPGNFFYENQTLEDDFYTKKQVFSDNKSFPMDSVAKKSLIKNFSNEALQRNLLHKKINSTSCESMQADFSRTQLLDNEFLQEKNTDFARIKKESDFLRISATYSITLMPGLPLCRIIPLIKFMEVKSFDSVASFEISKKSVLRALDQGLKPNDIFEELLKNCSFDLPQNLIISIEEWNTTYSSAELFCGFILKTDIKNKILTEKNPILAQHIKKILSDGIFLLDAKDADEAQELIKKCGVDFIGKVKTTVDSKANSTSFPNLLTSLKAQWASSSNEVLNVNNTHPSTKELVQNAASVLDKSTEQNDLSVQNKINIKNEVRDKKNQTNSNIVNDYTTSDNMNIVSSKISKSEKNEYLTELRETLNNMNLGAEQKEILELRIKRKIILNKEQLKNASVRIEKTEARAMDFSGKIHLIERAISSKNMIEIGVKAEIETRTDTETKFLGIPLSIEKHETDSFVHIKVEPMQNEKIFSIAQASFVKLIRTSIL